MSFRTVWAVGMLSIILGFLIGVYQTPPPTPELFKANFESATGINPDSFLAAGKDCEVFHNEPCRIYGGWAPRSQFADEVPE